MVEPVCAAGEAWGQTAGWVCVTESPGRALLSAPCQPAGLGENTSPVYVTEVEFMRPDPCFLGKLAWLVIPLSSGTETDVEG